MILKKVPNHLQEKLRSKLGHFLGQLRSRLRLEVSMLFPKQVAVMFRDQFHLQLLQVNNDLIQFLRSYPHMPCHQNLNIFEYLKTVVCWFLDP